MIREKFMAAVDHLPNKKPCYWAEFDID